MKHNHGFFLASVTWICLIAAMFAVSSTVQGAVVTNISVADGQIINTSPNANRGAQAAMFVGGQGVLNATDEYRSLLRFSLTNIPTGSVITSATLRLTVSSQADTTVLQSTSDVYRLKVPWVEGDGVSGATSGTSGATWNSQDKAGSLPNWTVAGADGAGTDREAVKSFSIMPTDYSGGNPYVLNKDVLTDVLAWWTGTENDGWIMKVPTLVSTQYVGYSTKEESNVTFRPQLIIAFVPEPATVALGGAGFILLLVRNRSRKL